MVVQESNLYCLEPIKTLTPVNLPYYSLFSTRVNLLDFFIETIQTAPDPALNPVNFDFSGKNPGKVSVFSPNNTNLIFGSSKDLDMFDSDYGECIEWDASNLTHGNEDNITSNTRVSFDFRVIPKSRYIEIDNNLTINTKIPFGIGGYYGII